MKTNSIIELVLKAIALAMGVVIIILTILNQFKPELNILIGIGLFTLSLASLLKED